MKRPPEYVFFGVMFSVIAWACALGMFAGVVFCIGQFLWTVLQLPAPVLVFVPLGTLIIYGMGATSHRQKP